MITIVLDTRWIRGQKIDGIGRYTLKLTKRLLSSSKDRKYVLLFDSQKDKFFFVKESKITFKTNIKPVIVPFRFLTLKDFFYLPIFLRNLDTDIFWSFNFITSPFHKGYKLIVSLHDLTPFLFKEQTRKASLGWKVFYKMPFLTNIILKRVSRVLVVSQNTANDLQKLFRVPTEKVSVVYNGIDQQKRAISQEIQKDVLRKYNVNKDFIFYLGRQDPYKNLKKLILAYNDLPKKLKERYLLVLGGSTDNPYYRELSDSIKKLNLQNKVIFTDYLTDDESLVLYKRASLFVLVSLYEGFGFPILEAMQQETPVLVSRFGATKEVAGSAAYFVDPKSVASISSGIKKMLGDNVLRKELIEKGLQRSKDFDWDKSVKEINLLIDKLANEKTI